MNAELQTVAYNIFQRLEYMRKVLACTRHERFPQTHGSTVRVQVSHMS